MKFIKIDEMNVYTIDEELGWSKNYAAMSNPIILIDKIEYSGFFFSI